MHLLFEQRRAVMVTAVLTKLFAMVGADDHRSVGVALAKQRDHRAGRGIGRGHLAIVALLRLAAARELRLRIVWLMRLEQMHPHQERMTGLRLVEVFLKLRDAFMRR